MNETETRTQALIFDRIFELIWEEFGDGTTDGCLCTELDESLWTEEGFHPWDGLLYGYELETRLTYAQTLESPAEYLTVGRLFVTTDGYVELATIDAGEFQ